MKRLSGTILFAIALLLANQLRAQDNHWAPGTLAYYLSTNTTAHARGHSNINNDECEVSGWNYLDYSGTNFQRLMTVTWSKNFWLRGVQGLAATPVGISNNLAGQTLLTMVSPRHYLRAHHVGVLRQFIAFLDTNNVIYLRKPLQQVQVGTSDTDVGILDADLPPSVGYLPVIPADYSKYLPSDFAYVQGIGMNQGLMLFSEPLNIQNPFVTWNSQISVPYGLPVKWDVPLRGGDSSDPVMLLINNQLVLVSHNFFATGGPNYAPQIGAINQQMHYLSTNNDAGSDYQLTPFSLTNWPTVH